MAKATLADVARDTGYTVATVSNVLNNRKGMTSETARARILEAVKRLNYVPDHFARGLRSRRSFVIGIAARLSASDFMSLQIPPLRAECERAGYFAFLADLRKAVPQDGKPREDVPGTLEALVRVRVDGIIMWEDRDSEAEFRVPPLTVPIVAISSYSVPGARTVVLDRAEGALRATNYLIGLGHRNIIFLARKPKFHVGKIRGYRRAMEQAGLAPLAKVAVMSEAWDGAPAFVAQNLDLLRSTTAVLAQGERVVLDLINALRVVGISVPRDLSIVNLGNVLGLEMDPPVTTVELPRNDIARVTMKMMLDLIAGKEVEEERLVPSLVLRRSVAPPRPQ